MPRRARVFNAFAGIPEGADEGADEGGDDGDDDN